MGIEPCPANMKVLLLSLFLGLAFALPGDEYARVQFAKFKMDHQKVYKTRSEHESRFQVFAENLKMIAAHNNAGHSYTLGINQFSDLTQEEFERLYLGGYKALSNPSTSQTQGFVKKAIKDLPESVDWRDMGAVTDVKNQGQCGSCWAFATTEMIESYAAIATGSLPTLSAQQVTSCTPNPLSCGGTGGCMGSIPQLGYTYLQLFGHALEDDYPYVSGSTTETEDCLYDINNTAPKIGITGYDTFSNDQVATMNHLANVGPLAVAVDASVWHSYSSGVFTGCSFEENIGLNHAVQLVGYGTDPAEGDYWLVGNSWGTGWGEGGYIRLQRQAEAQCGVDSTPMSGTACVDGPGNDEQYVCGQCGVLFDMSYPLGAHVIEN